MMWFVAHGSVSPNGESLLALPKSNQKASPSTPLLPPVLATGGTRRRHTKASLSLRTVCADDASTTARCSAPRRGLKGRLVRKQLFGEGLDLCWRRPINGHLSTLGFFYGLAHIKWAFLEKAACSHEGAKRIPGSRDVRSAGIKFHFTTLRNPDASIRATWP